ncbi:alpha-ketoglutarate-dependent dioxygenase AlkB [Escherichia coli]
MQAISEIACRSPFRQMVTPGGYTMSVAMTNCGELGWTTNQHGYVYAADDPLTGKRWPQMPPLFRELAAEAAAASGLCALYPGCVSYQPLSAGNEALRCIRIKTSKTCERRLFPSLWGFPAIFQFGGLRRNDPLQRVLLEHGDVVVWGGESRLFYHGIQPLKEGIHPATGGCRYNLTFRLAGNKE